MSSDDRSERVLIDDGRLSAPAEDDPWLGRELLGRYAVESELGWGSLGRVFKIRDRHAPQLGALALKAVRRDRLSPASRAYLEHEFRQLVRLRHPHVVAAHRFDAADGVPFFVLDLVEGETLVKAGRRLGWEATVELLAQSLRSLAYLHQRGLIHMDLKPQNLLVVEGRAGPQVKLIDLHLSRLRHVPHDGTMRGTIAYMAPEVVRGREVDARADLYSLGAVAYEALCGKAPFAEAGSPMDVLRGHAQRSPLLFEARGVKDVPEELEEWVRCLLAKRPGERYEDAHEALRALASSLGRELPLETQATRQSYSLRGALTERESEQRAVLAAAADLREGRGGATFALIGEEGIGKTRLLDELGGELSLAGLAVQHVRPVRGQSEAILAALEGFERRHAGSQERIQLEPRDASGQLPALVRRVSALLEVLRRNAEREPCALLVDELEGLDLTSAAVVRELLAESLPLLVVVATRETASLHLSEEGAVSLRELANLTHPGAEALVGSLVGRYGEPVPPVLTERLWEATGGNPGHLEQAVADLLEGGGLVDALGVLCPRPEDAERVLPSASLGELTAGRVARLGEDARALLAGLATSAEAATLRFAAAVAELPAARARDALAELLRGGFVRPLGPIQGPLALDHAPLRRAVAATISAERRQALHARALRLIESRHPATLPAASEPPGREGQRDRSEELLWHAERAEVWGEAFEHARRAADAAAREEDHLRARGLYERALALLARLEEEGQSKPDVHLPLTLSLAAALAATGQRPRALELLAPLDGPLVRSPSGLRLRARLRKDAGDFVQALADLERAEEQAREELELERGAQHEVDRSAQLEAARCQAERASVLLWRGDYAAAQREGEAALAALEGLLPGREAGVARETEASETVSAEARALLAHDDLVRLRAEVVQVQDTLYHACHFLGQGKQATAYLQRGLEARQSTPPRTRQQDPPPSQVTATLRRALKRGKVPLLGDAAGAQVPRSIVEAAFERADRADELLQLHLRRSRLLEEAGDLDGAAYALLNLAHLRRARGRLEEARERYARAAQLFAATGCRVGEALVGLSQARLRAQVG